MENLRVLLATDGSEPATRAAELLVRMAEGPIEARVFTAVSFTLYPYALYPGGGLSDEASRIRGAEEEVEHATRDARLILEKAGVGCTIGHAFGNAADEILAEVDRWKPDVLLMGRRGVRGLERMIGSVSEHVVRRSRVPVLLVP